MSPDGELLAELQEIACLDCVPMITLTAYGDGDESTAVVVARHPRTCPTYARLAAAEDLTDVREQGTIVHFLDQTTEEENS